jgi:PilZ domain
VSARLTARIVPPQPITVAITEEGGAPLAFGVIADISEGGGCVWTDAHLSVEATLEFRISFARPSEMYSVIGSVVWGQDRLPGAGHGGRRYGIRWLATTVKYRRRLRELADRAMPPRELGPYRFQKPWTVLDV